jgi:hypothetical protein
MATVLDTTILPAPGSLDLYRMPVEKHEQLAEAGILKGPRVELIGGYLARKTTKKPDHVLAVEGLRDALVALDLTGWRILVQDPVRLPEFDEPEPALHSHGAPARTTGDATPAPRTWVWSWRSPTRAWSPIGA